MSTTSDALDFMLRHIGFRDPGKALSALAYCDPATFTRFVQSAMNKAQDQLRDELKTNAGGDERLDKWNVVIQALEQLYQAWAMPEYGKEGKRVPVVLYLELMRAYDEWLD